MEPEGEPPVGNPMQQPCEIVNMSGKVQFPITVKSEDGETCEYEDKSDIEMNLEDFDSEIDTACDVRDALGRRVYLIVSLLEIKELRLKDFPSPDDAKACWDSEEDRTSNDPAQLRRTKWARGNYEFMMRHGLAKRGLFVFALGLLLLILWFVFFR